MKINFSTQRLQAQRSRDGLTTRPTGSHLSYTSTSTTPTRTVYNIYIYQNGLQHLHLQLQDDHLHTFKCGRSCSTRHITLRPVRQFTTQDEQHDQYKHNKSCHNELTTSHTKNRHRNTSTSNTKVEVHIHSHGGRKS